jgi:hypothetical protein
MYKVKFKFDIESEFTEDKVVDKKVRDVIAEDLKRHIKADFQRLYGIPVTKVDITIDVNEREGEG